MSAGSIGIFGRKVDRQVTDLRDALDRLGVEPVVVDFHNFPRFNLVSLQRETVRWDDINLPCPAELDRLELVHLRSACSEELAPEATPSSLDAPKIAAHYRRQVARLALQLGLARRLARRVPVLNPVRAFVHHRQKGHQYRLLARAGLPVPRTLVTADLERARAFASEMESQLAGAVVKPQAGGAEVVRADEAFFAAAAPHRGRRPYVFQQYVKGRSLRAYLLGGRVVSMGELEYDRRLVDWREHVQRALPHTPSARLARTLAHAVRLLEMPYCGVDLELDQTTGQLYLLDFNPSALFASWGRMTGTDMAGLLAEYLIEVARTRDPWAA